jgi:hypothetical protein
MAGRPSLYTREISDKICEGIANGRTLNQICREPGMPARPTVMAWVLGDVDGISDRYARARDLMLEHWAEEVIDIAEDGTNDWVEKQYKSGVQVVLDREHVSRSDLRINSRRWLLSKLKPEKYGERVTVKNEGNGDVEAEPESVQAERREKWVAKHSNGVSLNGNGAANGKANGNGKTNGH